MELGQAVRRRRMVRAFAGEPIPAEVLDRVLDLARRGPSAGFAQGTDLVVLEGSKQTSVLWSLVTTPDWRAASPRWPGLQAAPVVILPLAGRQAYLDRYRQADKATSGLGDPHAWPVPYWLVDTAFATMLLLLAAVDEGLGAAFLGIFRGQAELLAHLGVPGDYQAIGMLLLGYPAPDRPSGSLLRGRRPLHEVVHRGRW